MARVLAKMRGVSGYIMGDFNVDLIKMGTHGPTSDFLETFTAGGFYPLVSLPTRLTDTTATLIDNIMTNNLEAKMETGLVTVRVSDHLPIFAFVGGMGQDGGVGNGEGGGPRRVVTGARIRQFAGKLEEWDWREVRAMGVGDNVARFRNGFRDLYDGSFPVAQGKRRRIDEEKPWLDDPGFKELVKEKGSLYSRKLRGKLREGEGERLAEVTKEVNSTR